MKNSTPKVAYDCCPVPYNTTELQRKEWLITIHHYPRLWRSGNPFRSELSTALGLQGGWSAGTFYTGKKRYGLRDLSLAAISE